MITLTTIKSRWQSVVFNKKIKRQMGKPLHIKRGLNLNLSGEAQRPVSIVGVPVVKSETVALIPDDFTGKTPKMDVREGIHVESGEVLWHNTSYDSIQVVSPI